MAWTASDRSELRGGLIGFAIAAAIGAAIVLYMSIKNGEMYGTAGWKTIGALGLLGSTLGQFIAKGLHDDKHRAAEEANETPQSAGLGVWQILLIVVGVGSFGLSMLIALFMKNVMGVTPH